MTNFLGITQRTNNVQPASRLAQATNAKFQLTFNQGTLTLTTPQGESYSIKNVARIDEKTYEFLGETVLSGKTRISTDKKGTYLHEKQRPDEREYIESVREEEGEIFNEGTQKLEPIGTLTIVDTESVIYRFRKNTGELFGSSIKMNRIFKNKK